MVRSAPYESEFKPGQRVTALAMLGGWAEQVVVPPANLTPTPDDIDDAEAVALLGNYQTMYFALATPRRAAARRDGAGARARPAASAPRPFRSQRRWAPR